MKRFFASLALMLLSVSGQAQEVTLRHALTGRSLDTLSSLALRFNSAQKGKGKVVLQDLGTVSDRARLPHMALLNIDDSTVYFSKVTAYKPLYQVMKDSGQKFSTSGMYPQIIDAMSEKPGQLNALPLGLSLPVLYWNKELFRKAGVEPEVAPRTWHEVLEVAGKLIDARICPLTSSRFSWTQLENITQQQGQPTMTAGNRVALNGLINVKHIAMLASWYRSTYFRYYGPRDEANQHFLSGECAMLISESSLHSEIKAGGRIDAGVGGLPYYDDEYGVVPGNVSPDGVGLWMLAGKAKAEYQVMAKFAAFMMQRDVQQAWVKGTGYLPMTAQSIVALRESGMSPYVVDAAVRRLSKHADKFRLKSGPLQMKVRNDIGEQMELVWRDEVSSKQALDNAMQKANSAK